MPYNGYVVKACADGTYDVDFNDGDTQKNMAHVELQPWPKQRKGSSRSTDCLINGKHVAPAKTRASSLTMKKNVAVVTFYTRADMLSSPFADDREYDVMVGYEIDEKYVHAWMLNHKGGECLVRDILMLTPAEIVKDAEDRGAFTDKYDEILLMFTPDCTSASSADGVAADLAYYDRVMKHAVNVIRAFSAKCNVTFVFEFLNKSYIVDALDQAFPDQIETLTMQQHLLESRVRTFTLGRFGSEQQLLDAINVPPASLLSSP